MSDEEDIEFSEGGEDDFFPEQFEHFVVNHPKVRQRFLLYHPDLLEPSYWKKIQKDIVEKKRHDVFPYHQNRRFINRYPQQYTNAKHSKNPA